MKPHEHIILEVARERERQMAEEGWMPGYDDMHDKGELAAAAGCYTLYSDAYPNANWPWTTERWKPKNYRRNLVRAAALIVAEIERLDRAALNGGTDHDR